MYRGSEFTAYPAVWEYHLFPPGPSLEAVMAFRRVASLIPHDIPMILESRVAETEIQKEIDNAIHALDTSFALAIAGD